MDFQELTKSFIQLYGEGDTIHTFFAPGRVNLIGEHIDYNGGFVFPGALTIGIAALARRRNDGLIRLNSQNAEQEVIVDTTQKIVFDKADDWGNYPKGVFAFLVEEGHTLAGYDILYSGNVPDGAGLSSSAAIEVLTTYMMLSLGGQTSIDKVWIARFCQKVENKFIGVNSGIMDQFCVAMGKKDQAILLNTDSLEYQYVPFQLTGYSLVIMNTNKRRELADSKYNERRSECDKALAILNKQEHYRDLCSANLEVAKQLISDQVLLKRTRHVITENQRVLEAVEVLKKGDLASFGKLLNASHASLRDDYEVTGVELDTIAAESQKQPGCLGARMTGAGFGGCAIALVQNEHVEDFKRTVGEKYQKATGLKADFYPSQIGDGVHSI